MNNNNNNNNNNDNNISIRKKQKRVQLELQKAFGKILRTLRIAVFLTQEGLAELADLHFTYVSSVERGQRNLSLISMDKFAKALNCSLKDLMPY
jgi:DNA-binding XRE family transcriptional regulator